jgi:hypothetical protein
VRLALTYVCVGLLCILAPLVYIASTCRLVHWSSICTVFLGVNYTVFPGFGIACGQEYRDQHFDLVQEVIGTLASPCVWFGQGKFHIGLILCLCKKRFPILFVLVFVYCGVFAVLCSGTSQCYGCSNIWFCESYAIAVQVLDTWPRCLSSLNTGWVLVVDGCGIGAGAEGKRMVEVILNFIFDRGTKMPKARYWLMGKAKDLDCIYCWVKYCWCVSGRKQIYWMVLGGHYIQNGCPKPLLISTSIALLLPFLPTHSEYISAGRY